MRRRERTDVANERPLARTMADDGAGVVPVLGHPLIRRDVVGSTMDELRALARAGAAEGTTLVAEFQSAGRGRAGRGWQVPSGTSLLCSVLLRPNLTPAELTPLALLTATSVAEAIESVTGVQPMVKWPNDLLIGDRKVCGILASVSAASTGAPIVILGIGLNVNVDAADLPPGATSVALACGEPVDRMELLDAVLHRLTAMYRALLSRSFEDWWQRAAGRLAYVGESVVVREHDQVVRGVVTGVGGGGELCLTGEDGTRHVIVAGDVVRGPRRVSDEGKPTDPLVAM